MEAGVGRVGEVVAGACAGDGSVVGVGEGEVAGEPGVVVGDVRSEQCGPGVLGDGVLVVGGRRRGRCDVDRDGGGSFDVVGAGEGVGEGVVAMEAGVGRVGEVVAGACAGDGSVVGVGEGEVAGEPGVVVGDVRTQECGSESWATVYSSLAAADGVGVTWIVTVAVRSTLSVPVKV